MAVSKDRAAWQAKRAEIRRDVWDALGDLPPRPEHPTMTTTTATSYRGPSPSAFAPKPEDPRIENVQIADGPRPAIRAALVLPPGADASHRVPAVVWFDNRPQMGLMPFSEMGGELVPITLARRGFAVLSLEAIPENPPPWVESAPSSGQGTPWGQTLRRDLVALDALLTRPEIDPKRIAAAGVGLGAMRAWWLMGLDDRIACGTGTGGLARISDWRAAQGDAAPALAPWASAMLKTFDTEAVMALCAPRPLQAQHSDRDPLSPASGFKVLLDTARRAYSTEGERGGLNYQIYGRQGPEFTLLEWDAMLEWLDKHLLPQGPTPLGHAPEPEPVVDDRFIDPAAHGIAGWVSEMSQRPGTWSWRDGTIVCAPGPNEYGWLRCPVELDDFILSLDWKVPKGGNSGIFLRARPVTWAIPPGADSKPRVSALGLTWPSRTGLELQAQDDSGHADKYSSGSLYRHAAPAANPTRPPGEWNHYTVRCRGTRVEVWINGQQVLDTRLDQHPTLRRPPLRGYFGLQDHGVPAEFRNIRYLRLGEGEDPSRKTSG
jgi:hypothetical protein